MDRTHIIQIIEAHSRRTGLAPATITGRAVDNSRLYDRLINGGDCTTEIAKRIAAFIESAPTEQGSSRVVSGAAQ